MKKDQITDEKSSGANSEASANWKDFVRQICAINPKKPEATINKRS